MKKFFYAVVLSAIVGLTCFNLGKDSILASSNSTYQDGYHAGYTAGRKEGYNSGSKTATKQAEDSAYSRGFADGYNAKKQEISTSLSKDPEPTPTPTPTPTKTPTPTPYKTPNPEPKSTLDLFMSSMTGADVSFSVLPTEYEYTPSPTESIPPAINKKGYVSAGTANVREGPGTDYDKIGVSHRGDPVTVQRQYDDWYKVLWNGETGYIYADYVEIGEYYEPTPTPTPRSSSSGTVYGSSEKVETIVYITNTGSKYHRRSCHHLRQSCIEISKDRAIQRGYTACKDCRPG